MADVGSRKQKKKAEIRSGLVTQSAFVVTVVVGNRICPSGMNGDCRSIQFNKVVLGESIYQRVQVGSDELGQVIVRNIAR